MANIRINSVLQRVQYTATAAQTVFTIPFPFLQDNGIELYQDDTLLVQGAGGAEYVLAGEGTASGGTATLNTGATVGDIITIRGIETVDRSSIYSQALSNLTGSDLNNDFNRTILMVSQLNTDADLLQTRYAPYAEISQNVATTKDRLLPLLTAGTSWRMAADDSAIEALTVPTLVVGVDSAIVTDNVLMRADTSGTNQIQESGVVVDDSDDVTGIGNMVMSGALSGVTTLSMSGALSGLTTLTMNGGLSGVTTLSMGGALTGATSITMNGALSGASTIAMGGALTGVTTLSMGGALTGATSLTMGGALSGVTTLSMGGALTGVTSLTMNGALTGVTDLTASGTLTASGLIYPTSDGTANQVMGTDGAGNLSFEDGADGDVDGPASATDNAYARYDGTTGKLIQNSQVTESDAGAVVFPSTVTLNGDPAGALQAVTKQYADALAAVDVKESSVAASTAALTVTYDNGTLGVGATLTNAGAQAAFSLDGLSPSATDRVLIKNQASGFQNGIYTVTTVGSGGSNWVLTRATDNDEADEMLAGTLALIEPGGTSNSLTSWLQTSTVTTVGTDSVTYAQFNYGTNFPSITVTGTLTVTGTENISHTATATDDHALNVTCDADGFGDVRCIEANYITGAISTGDNESALLVNIDQSSATGGDIAGVRVLSTEGSADVCASFVGALVDPVCQLSGTFGNVGIALVKAVDRTTEFNATGSDIVMFVANTDTVTVGDAAKFQEIQFILDTVASGAGVRPTFEFSTGVGTWTSFTPTDGTNGFRQNGIIGWHSADIPSWATGVAGDYLIRITRSQVALTTTPIEDQVQISATSEYKWDKDGDLLIRNTKYADATGIVDDSDNEHLIFQKTATAVNYLEITNAATNNNPSFTGNGSDGNVGLLLHGKASGRVQMADGTDPTKILEVNTAGATGAKTMTVVSSHSNDRTLTLPDATDTLVGKATTDDLTNKSIDADNNTVSNIVIGAECTGASTALTDTADITYNADADVSANGWVVDEDNMVSDLATKVPTQQSVKAYVDAAGGGSDFVLLSTATASASATIDITLDAGYIDYLVIFSDMIPSTDSVDICFRTSTDAGSNFDSGASDYHYTLVRAASSNANVTGAGSTGIASMRLALYVGGAANESSSGWVKIHNPAAATYTKVTSQMLYQDTEGNDGQSWAAGSRRSAADVDAIQFLFSAGNITSGAFKLYGIENA